jgi:hypothetical protein
MGLDDPASVVAYLSPYRPHLRQAGANRRVRCSFQT